MQLTKDSRAKLALANGDTVEVVVKSDRGITANVTYTAHGTIYSLFVLKDSLTPILESNVPWSVLVDAYNEVYNNGTLNKEIMFKTSLLAQGLEKRGYGE
jgi:hypothetical protein